MFVAACQDTVVRDVQHDIRHGAAHDGAAPDVVAQVGVNILVCRPDKEARLDTQLIGDQPAYVEADPTQVEQVLLNLMINAVQAMQDGGTGSGGQPNGGAAGELILRIESDAEDTGFELLAPSAALAASSGF